MHDEQANILNSLSSFFLTATPPSEIITIAPRTQYVPFNINANVNFSCEVIGTMLIWEFNDLQLLNLIPNVFAEDGLGSGEMGNITRNSTLLVTVNETGTDRNGSRIRCFPPENTDTEDAILWTYGESLWHT